MKRRILALLLPLALLLSLGAQAVVTDEGHDDPPGVYRIMEAEAGPLLPRSRAYSGQFADVPVGSWYYDYAVLGYEYGLFEGRGDGFAPGAEITVAELLTLSARLHAVYAGDILPAAGGSPWYAPYVSYLDACGLLDPSIADYDAPATRAQLAAIFALSLPESCYGAPNASLVDDAYASGRYITDVGEATPYQPQILWMYRQGLLEGMDPTGSYWPDVTTTRAETAALVIRMVDPSQRLTLSWAVAPAWSAAGKTLASLVEAPQSVDTAPAYDDGDALDALICRMLAGGGNTIELDYPKPLAASDAQTLARIFSERVKRYCEQMYNFVECQYYLNSGHALLSFYATVCLPPEGAAATSQERAALMDAAARQLAQFRDETTAQAIAVHDALWESGVLHAGMSQTEIARVYYQWLCEHCAYDADGVNDDYSISHIAYGALLRGSAVCDGYTGAYNLFLKLEGISCRALSNSSHIWTVAELDGQECHIDVTWGDQGDEPNWDFFAMSEEASRQAHAW